jgi:thioredoxin-like negative regulator of GroEL
MESLLAVRAWRERDRLRFVTVDVDEFSALAESFGIADVPTLVLLCDRKPVARLAGRVTASRIDAMLRNHLADGEELGLLYRLRTRCEGRKNQPLALKAVEGLIEEYEAKPASGEAR